MGGRGVSLPFGSAALPERLRLGAQQQLPAFERVAHLAARATASPMALVTLLTGDGQWNVGRYGVDDAELPLNSSICQRVLPAEGLQQVADPATDARMATLELIASLREVRFYAGQPILFRGRTVGMVCVLDTRERRIDPDDAQALHDLATIVAEHLETLDQQVMTELERQRAEHFASASGDWFWELDAELRYAWLSPNFEAATGLEPSALIGRPAGRIRTVPQLLTEEPAPVQHLLERHEDFFGVLVEARLHGEPRLVKLNGLALHDDDGRFLGYRGTGRDVTEFTSAVRAAEREALQRESAEKSAEAKSAFLSRASHELRTPLNAIIGFTQLMQLNRDEPLPPRLREQVALVAQASDHLLALVNDVLDLSRLEHTPPTQTEPVALKGLVGDVLALLQVDAARRDVQVQAEVPPGLQAQAVPHDLRRALLNLVSNAIKYNREGGQVTVSALSDPLAGRVQLAVRDTGIGIAPEAMGQLFQPFNRLGAQKTSVQGSGLGLVIARALVRGMGGDLRVESVPGCGTTVWLELLTP